MLSSDYQRLAARTECDQEAASRRRLYFDVEVTANPLIATRLNHAVLGLAGEIGELAAAIEHWIHYGQDLDPVNILEELGDCLWYIALACNALGVQLGGVMEANIHKLQVRYPEKYQSSLAAEENRDREAERIAVKTPSKFLGGYQPEIEEVESAANYSKPLTNTYNRYCSKCGFNPIHKNNTTGLCPDCYEETRAKNLESLESVTTIAMA